MPQSYTASINSKKSETIKINLAGGAVKDFSIDPEPPVDPDRIVVTPDLKKGVVDPMTSTMVRVPGTGELLTPDACRGQTSVFDGRLRYDLKMDFKRMETVQAEKGYSGPAVVCALYFTPVAGYIPDRPVIKYLAAERQHGDHPGADRRHARPGAVPHRHPDAVRPRRAGGDAVQHGRAAAEGGEDAVAVEVTSPRRLRGEVGA